MAFKVFYAWQSDRPNNLCRGLIRQALDRAAAILNEDLTIEDAERSVQIDQDTQGVPGSPGVADTILEKIRSCDAFVPDLTIIHDGSSARQAPNPNVLIEYGYALHAIGDRRIIGVLNEGFGTPDDLPFDLRHKKWPVRYVASDSGDTEEAQQQRRAARDRLAATLADAIREILRVFAQEKKVPLAASLRRPAGPSASPESGREAEPHTEVSTESAPQALGVLAQYPWENRLVGYRAEREPGEQGYEMHLLDGPSISLHVKSRNSGVYLPNVDNLRIVQRALQPLAYFRSTGRDIAYNRHGVAVFTTLGGQPNTALAASILTRHGELYGIDCYHLQVARFKNDPKPTPYIPVGAVEEVLIDGLVNFLDVAKNHLGLPPPIEISAGLQGIANYRLAIDPRQFGGADFVGPILANAIGETTSIQNYECDPFEVLVKLFNNIYDEAFVERPNVRTIGKSQR